MCTSRVVLLKMLSVPWVRVLLSMTVFQMINAPSVILDDLVKDLPSWGLTFPVTSL